MGEGTRLRIAILLFHSVKIQGITLETGRGPGFESAQRKAKLPEGIGERMAGSLPHPPAGKVCGSNMNKPLHECPGGDQDGPGAEEGPVMTHEPDDPSPLNDQALDPPLKQIQPRLSLQNIPHRQMIVSFVAHGS